MSLHMSQLKLDILTGTRLMLRSVDQLQVKSERVFSQTVDTAYLLDGNNLQGFKY